MTSVECRKHKVFEDVERGEVKCSRCGLVLAPQILTLSPSDWRTLGGPVKDVGEATDYVDVKLRKVVVKWLRLKEAKRVVTKQRVYYRRQLTKCMAVTVTFNYRRKRRSIILPWTLIEKILPHVYTVRAQKRRGPRVRDTAKIAKAVRAIHRALTDYGVPSATTITAALVKLTERRVQQLLSAEQKSKSHVERGKKAKRKVKKSRKVKAKKTSRRCK